MTADIGTAPTDFEALAAAHRDQIRLHCYRMLGSIHDAEDATQEALLGAWKAMDSFEGRSSLSTWLHGIATNVCLTMLRNEKRAGEVLGARAGDGSLDGEVPWLTPIPGQLLPVSQPEHPEAAMEAAEATRLAFVSAIQMLPPRQRAALILKDVLGWSVAEIAEATESTTAGVNSALQRARKTVAVRPTEVAAAAETAKLVERWLQRWRAKDMAGLADLLATDARLAMPPEPLVVHGPRAITDFIRDKAFSADAGPAILRQVNLNGEPAAAAYLPDSDGNYAAYGMMAFAVAHNKVQRLTAFPGVDLFRLAGLPLTLDS